MWTQGKGNGGGKGKAKGTANGGRTKDRLSRPICDTNNTGQGRPVAEGNGPDGPANRTDDGACQDKGSSGGTRKLSPAEVAAALDRRRLAREAPVTGKDGPPVPAADSLHYDYSSNDEHDEQIAHLNIINLSDALI